MENLTKGTADQFQTVRVDRTTFAKKQAHSQIHAFMDCYQKDMIGRLAPNPLPRAQPQDIEPLNSSAEDGSSAIQASNDTHPKNDRARLHQIWLAMKPVYKPATAF